MLVRVLNEEDYGGDDGDGDDDDHDNHKDDDGDDETDDDTDENASKVDAENIDHGEDKPGLPRLVRV